MSEEWALGLFKFSLCFETLSTKQLWEAFFPHEEHNPASQKIKMTNIVLAHQNKSAHSKKYTMGFGENILI